MKNKKIIMAIAFLGALLFALVPIVAYGLLLFAGLSLLSFPSLILSVLAKLVWIAAFLAIILPQVVGFIAAQFLVGFAEVVEVLWARDRKDEQEFTKDLPEIPATDKEVK